MQAALLRWLPFHQNVSHLRSGCWMFKMFEWFVPDPQNPSLGSDCLRKFYQLFIIEYIRGRNWLAALIATFNSQ